MKTAINGKVRYKFYWGAPYSGGGMKFLKRVFRIGRLLLAKVVYPTESPFSKEYYRQDVLSLLREVYDVRWQNAPLNGRMWYAVYSKIDGGYVGTPGDAYRFWQWGLRDIQQKDSEDKVCSIGFNPKEQKWYGWSHRAMYGFGVGDIVKEGDCCATSGWTEEYLKTHDDPYVLPVGFEAKTIDDAKRMAIAFAASVS